MKITYLKNKNISKYEITFFHSLNVFINRLGVYIKLLLFGEQKNYVRVML